MSKRDDLLVWPLALLPKSLKSRAKSPGNSDSAHFKYHFFLKLSFSLCIYRDNKSEILLYVLVWFIFGQPFVFFPSIFIIKNFIHTELPSKHSYTDLLASTINIFLYLFFHMSVHPSIHLLFFDAFCGMLQPSVHFTPEDFSMHIIKRQVP